jgi:hypothetical protein
MSPVPAVQLERKGGAGMPDQILHVEIAVTLLRQAIGRPGFAG